MSQSRSGSRSTCDVRGLLEGQALMGAVLGIVNSSWLLVLPLTSWCEVRLSQVQAVMLLCRLCSRHMKRHRPVCGCSRNDQCICLLLLYAVMI